MKIYIDTNTFSATPGIYADAEKTKPLPRVIPLVQGFRGTVQIAFLGELAPKAGDGVTLAMRPFGTQRDILVTPPVSASTDTGEDGVVAVAEINLAVNTDALTTALSDRETLNLLCGVVVTDDNAAFPTRVEWQLVFAVSASALANGVPPDISPAAAEQLRAELESVKTGLSENYVDKSSAQTILGRKTFSTGNTTVNTGGGLLVGRLANDGSEGLWSFDGEGLRLEAILSGVGFLTAIGTNGVSADSVKGRYLCGTFIRSVSSLADGSLGGLISVPHVPADTPVGQETLALKSDIPKLQGLFSGHDGSNINVGSARIFVTSPVDGGYFSGFQLSDFASRIFAVSPGGAMNGFMAMAADGTATNRVFGAPLQLGAPARNNDEAPTFGQVKERCTPLLETVPPVANNNADAFGYLGTLRSLGAFGGAVLVSQISVFNRASGNIQNGNVSIWARVLKIVDGAWVVAAQSENSVKWNDYEHNAEISFAMRPVPGVTPPCADETIAIVFVNSETAAAGVSNGRLSFRTITLHGGIANALNAPNNLNAGNSWAPRIKLRFAALAGVASVATRDELESALERLSTLEERILAIENA